KKEMISLYKKEVSRIGTYDLDEDLNPKLTEDQHAAITAIGEFGSKGMPTLIQGVTGSGKTQVYVELIKSCLASGKQALYLLPEIALTTQMVQRIKGHFGEQLHVYHSKINDQERVELWHKSRKGCSIFLGPRSALFLPYYNLGLIIVDEE